MGFVVLIMVASLLAAWWCELTTKVKVGDIREFYLGENHPLNNRVVRIDHKGFLFWRVCPQRCVLGYTANDGQLVTLPGSNELGTVTNYDVVNGFTEDVTGAYIPIWLIRAILDPQMPHAETEGMRYVGDVPNENLNSWYTED